MTHSPATSEQKRKRADPAPLERLYVSDEELPQMGVDAEFLETFINMLDRNPKSGFPKKDPMLGNKRHWPSVRDWFEMYNRRRPQVSSTETFRDRKSA